MRISLTTLPLVVYVCLYHFMPRIRMLGFMWLKNLPSNRYLTDGGLHLYARNVGRASDLAPSREVSQRGGKDVQGDIDRYGGNI